MPFSLASGKLLSTRPMHYFEGRRNSERSTTEVCGKVTQKSSVASLVPRILVARSSCSNTGPKTSSTPEVRRRLRACFERPTDKKKVHYSAIHIPQKKLQKRAGERAQNTTTTTTIRNSETNVLHTLLTYFC